MNVKKRITLEELYEVIKINNKEKFKELLYDYLKDLVLFQYKKKNKLKDRIDNMQKQKRPN